MRYRTVVPVLVTALAVTLAACGSSKKSASPSSGSTTTTAAPSVGGNLIQRDAANASKPTITIGSKNFTEEFIVAEMYALVLENAGFKVERKFNLGDTPVAQAGLLKGDLDLYPEYTSTGLLTVLKKQALTDPKEIYNTVKSGYEQQFKLTWLDASPFNDTEGLATTKTIADKYQLKTFTDLSTKAPQLILGGAPEFAAREDGIKGLQKTYGGFQFKEFKQLGTGTLRYDALKGGQIDIVEVFTTDARIGSDNLVVLQDDKTFYPVYNVAPVIRQDTLAANPKIADALNKLAPLLTDDVIRKLNAQVDIDSMEYQAVAKDFLTKQGLVKS